MHDLEKTLTEIEQRRKQKSVQGQKTQPTHEYARDTLVSSFTCVELGVVDVVGAAVAAEELGFAGLGTNLDSTGNKLQSLQTAGLEEGGAGLVWV